MQVGIDLINFYSPAPYISAEDLAKERNIDPDKYSKGLGIHKISVPLPDEDIVTMGAQAALPIIQKVGVNNIDTLLFATETGIDQSKSAGIFTHRLLNLSKRCRVVEMKQACYAGVAALMLACDRVRQSPGSKVLVIASDIARYKLGSNAEPTQGAGACALLVTSDPRTLVIEPRSSFITDDVMDFWRPNYMNTAMVNGKFSCDQYLKLLRNTWEDFNNTDFERYCFHIPFPRMVEKAYSRVIDQELDKISDSLAYSREIGNCYTASIFIGLVGILDYAPKEAVKIGFYSYGSGSVAEFFSGIVQPTSSEVSFIKDRQYYFSSRTKLAISEYESYHRSCQEQIKATGKLDNPCVSSGFRFSGVEDHIRKYENYE
jgi:hydroxymethylglutaryl-CoA synthase